MAMLKSGASAVDAVEIAIVVLEDCEITNAGYGSNLTLEGKVECDATIVNHEGRSGAAGAVSRKSLLNVPTICLLVLAYHLMPARCQESNLLGPCYLKRLSQSPAPAPGAPKLPCGIWCYRLRVSKPLAGSFT